MHWVLAAAIIGWLQLSDAVAPVPLALHALMATKVRLSVGGREAEKTGKYRLLT
jgi:hypothetical protein